MLVDVAGETKNSEVGLHEDVAVDKMEDEAAECCEHYATKTHGDVPCHEQHWAYVLDVADSKGYSQ